MMIKVLHFSPHGENCGIGKYQEQYVESMQKVDDVKNDFFELSPYATRWMSKKDFKAASKRLFSELKQYDILHIQHELSFFQAPYQFDMIVRAGRRAGVKVVVTYHTSPDIVVHTPSRTGIRPRALIAYARAIVGSRRMQKFYTQPLKLVDLIIVHNLSTKDSMVRNGIPADSIRILPIPVPEVGKVKKTSYINDALRKKNDDIVVGLAGFIHRNKGIFPAIRAMSLLPSNYKLAVIGGVHSGTDDPSIEDRATDLIVELGLQERVFITGYVEDDDLLNSYVQEVDICIYPYDIEYYKNASSASINLSIANSRPIVAYPVQSFIEINGEFNELVLTESASYCELAREIKTIKIPEQLSRVRQYAAKYSYSKAALSVVELYKDMLS